MNCSKQDIDWLNGYKIKSHIYAVHKRPTADLTDWNKTIWVTDWKGGVENRHSMQMENKKKARLPILISKKKKKTLK